MISTRVRRKYDKEKYLNLKEVSLLAGTPLSLLEEQILKGNLQAERIDGEWYVSKEVSEMLNNINCRWHI